MIKPIYLDYNGTTPHDPEVIEAMRPFLETEFGNPSSSHWYGIKPKQAVETARRQVAGILNCSPAEVFFTSGGTESNNHAIRGVARRFKAKCNHIITSSFEHPAVLEVCRRLESDGFETTYLPVGEDGLVDPADVARAVRPTTILITIMHANNEVGTVQPIAEISRIAKQNGIVMHTDAAQSVGKIPTDVNELGVDLLSVAGHKVYAPKGIGALYVRPPLVPEKFCYGAGQEMGRRAGTENVLEIVGLGKACEIARRDLDKNMAPHEISARPAARGAFGPAGQYSPQRPLRTAPAEYAEYLFQGAGSQPHPGRYRTRGGRIRRRRLPLRFCGNLPCAACHGRSAGMGQRNPALQRRPDDDRSRDR